MTHGTPEGDDPVGAADAAPGANSVRAARSRRTALAVAGAVVVVVAVLTVVHLTSQGTGRPAATATPPGTLLPAPTPVSTEAPSAPPPGSALAAWPLWSTVPAGNVDLAAAPRRHVDLARAVVRTLDPEDASGPRQALYALDADRTWVRLDLPDGIPTAKSGVALSADGRSIAYTDGGEGVALIDLATGTARTVTIPPAATTGCRPTWSAFSPDGLHLAVLSECGTELSEGAPGRSVAVEEVTLGTGDIRQVETLPGAYPPPQGSIAYSPDGTTIVVGVLDVGSDNAGVVDVVARDGTPVVRWTGTFAVNAVDPWRDDHTLLGAGLDSTGSGTTLWLDTTTGTASPATVAPPSTDVSLVPMLFSDGMLVARADPTSGATPGSTLWVTDPQRGTRAQWLTFTGVSVLGVLLPTAA
ncbi:MAG: WD40 repeat domain-containing protein [Cellulomonas sp.]